MTVREMGTLTGTGLFPAGVMVSVPCRGVVLAVNAAAANGLNWISTELEVLPYLAAVYHVSPVAAVTVKFPAD